VAEHFVQRLQVADQVGYFAHALHVFPVALVHEFLQHTVFGVVLLAQQVLLLDGFAAAHLLVVGGLEGQLQVGTLLPHELHHVGPDLAFNLFLEVGLLLAFGRSHHIQLGFDHLEGSEDLLADADELALLLFQLFVAEHTLLEFFVFLLQLKNLEGQGTDDVLTLLESELPVRLHFYGQSCVRP